MMKILVLMDISQNIGGYFDTKLWEALLHMSFLSLRPFVCPS